MTNDTHLGPYELIKRIGYGGMAEIYLARTQGIGGFEKILALKVIHPKFAQDQEFVDMLIDEAKIAVQLNHVNICQIFDLGCIEGRFFIAMEFVDGRDLYQLLVEGADKDSLLPFELVAFIGREVAAGLHYAHKSRSIWSAIESHPPRCESTERFGIARRTSEACGLRNCQSHGATTTDGERRHKR